MGLRVAGVVHGAIADIPAAAGGDAKIAGFALGEAIIQVGQTRRGQRAVPSRGRRALGANVACGSAIEQVAIQQTGLVGAQGVKCERAGRDLLTGGHRANRQIAAVAVVVAVDAGEEVVRSGVDHRSNSQHGDNEIFFHSFRNRL